MELSTAVPHAQGATGRVLRAWDEQTGREVAIKVLRADDPQLAQRMAREIDALRRLSQPHICPILDVTDYDGQPALVMPFIDGAPIDRALAETDLQTRLAVMQDVAAAVQAAHHAGIVHRDLKPGNILVESIDGRPHAWVLDFGLARRVEDETLTVEGQILGTPGYLAPEQAEGRTATERSDIYGLGVVLFEVLTGRRPHEGETPTELLLATVSRDAPSIRSLDPRIPVSVARVVTKCLERRPRLRYASARDLYDDLQAIADGRPVGARGIGPIYRLRRQVLRSPLLTAALLLAGLGVLAAGWTRWRAAQEQREVAAASRALEQKVARVERELERIYLAPTHPVSDQVAAITAQALAEAERTAKLASGPVAAAAMAATGRLLQAAEDRPAALAALEDAWQGGLRDPSIAQRLGELHVTAYFDALANARRQQEQAAREHMIAQAKAHHGEAARRYLDQADESDAIVLALRARLSDDLKGALGALASAGARPWPVPAWLVTLRLRLDELGRLTLVGEQEAATAMADAAQPLARDLTAFARSHPEAWRLACDLETRELDLRIAGVKGRDRASEACATLAVVDPAGRASQIMSARGWVRQARLQLLEGGNPDEAIRAGLARLEGAAGDPVVEGLRGALLMIQAQRELNTPSAPVVATLRTAITSLQSALDAAPDDPERLADLARAKELLGDQLYRMGEDGDGHFKEATAQLQTVLTEHPEYVYLRRRLVDLLSEQGYQRSVRGRDAVPVLLEAMRQADAALARWPKSTALLSAKGMAARTLAEHQLQSGDDPTSAAQASLAAYEAVLAQQPRRFAARFNQVGVPIAMARYALRKGEDPAPWLARTDQYLEALSELVQDRDEIAIQVGIRHSLSAQAQLGRGPWPAAALSTARERLAVALGRQWDRVQAQLFFAELAASEHAAARAAGRLDRGRLAADMEMLARALKESPELHEMRLYRARLLALAVEFGVGAPAAELDPAAEQARALRGNPMLKSLLD